VRVGGLVFFGGRSLTWLIDWPSGGEAGGTCGGGGGGGGGGVPRVAAAEVVGGFGEG
jgi:hypothetical protein